MNPEETPTQSETGAHPQGGPTVDVEALAERVYRLMLAEIRHERARGAGLGRRKE